MNANQQQSPLIKASSQILNNPLQPTIDHLNDNNNSSVSLIFLLYYLCSKLTLGLAATTASSSQRQRRFSQPTTTSSSKRFYRLAMNGKKLISRVAWARTRCTRIDSAM
jgi:hypothetical protein